MKYVDGYVVPVPKKRLSEYRRMAEKASRLWKKHGALQYVEAVADDVKKGAWTSFPQSVKLKTGEVVVFAYITYKSRAHRDSVNSKVMKDPAMHSMCNPKDMPFDGKRMFWGGFKTIVKKR